MMERIYSPSPSVSSSRVPLYMQGWPTHAMLEGLGDDFSDAENIFLDTGLSIPEPGTIDTTMYDPSGSLVAPASLPTNTQDIANLYASAVATGAITPGQAASMAAQAINAAGNITKALGPSYAPSPRVATRLPAATVPSSLTSSLTAATIVPGIPNIAVIGGGLLLALAAMGGKR